MHKPVDVSNLDCDFYVYSGHKMYGPSGVGILYMKNQWFDQFDPYQGGGSMIDNVDFTETTFATGYQKFEAGTPPIAQVIGLGASYDFISQFNLQKIFNYEKELYEYAVDKLKSFNDVNIIGHSKNKGAILSFTIDNIQPELKFRSPENDTSVSGKVDIVLDVFDLTLKNFSITLPNGTKIDNRNDFTFDTNSIADGDYQLFTLAEDRSGNITEKDIMFNIDNIPPRISISSPSDGAKLGGTVNIEYDIKERSINNAKILVGERSIDIVGDYGSYMLDTTLLVDNEYVLQIIAQDEAGNTNSTSINIVVENLGPMLLEMQIMAVVIGLAIGTGITTIVLLAKYRKRNVEIPYDQQRCAYLPNFHRYPNEIVKVHGMCIRCLLPSRGFHILFPFHP